VLQRRPKQRAEPMLRCPPMKVIPMLPSDLFDLATRLRSFAVELRHLALTAADPASRCAALYIASDLEWRAACYERLVSAEDCNAAPMGVH
jgi:hypothetical protein